MTQNNGPVLEKWEIGRLRPHARQALFPAPPLHEVEALAEDIRANGLRQALDVSPSTSTTTSRTTRSRQSASCSWTI